MRKYYTLRFYNSFSCTNTCFWPPSINRFHGFPSQHAYIPRVQQPLKVWKIWHPTQAKFFKYVTKNCWSYIFMMGGTKLFFFVEQKSFIFLYCCCSSSLQWDVNLWYWGNVSKFSLLFNFNDWIHTIIL